MIGISAQMIATALGGRRAGGGWVARCPAHDDRDPSLSVRDGDNGKVLVCCHAGCQQQAVIASLRSLGLWQEQVGRRSGYTADTGATFVPGVAEPLATADRAVCDTFRWRLEQAAVRVLARDEAPPIAPGAASPSADAASAVSSLLQATGLCKQPLTAENRGVELSTPRGAWWSSYGPRTVKIGNAVAQLARDLAPHSQPCGRRSVFARGTGNGA